MEELDVQAMAIGPPRGYLSRGHTIALATPTQSHTTLDVASASLVSHALQQGLQQQQQQQQQAAAGSASQTRSVLGNREAHLISREGLVKFGILCHRFSR